LIFIEDIRRKSPYNNHINPDWQFRCAASPAGYVGILPINVNEWICCSVKQVVGFNNNWKAGGRDEK